MDSLENRRNHAIIFSFYDLLHNIVNGSYLLGNVSFKVSSAAARPNYQLLSRHPASTQNFDNSQFGRPRENINLRNWYLERSMLNYVIST